MPRPSRPDVYKRQAIYRMVTTKLDDLIQYSNEDGRGDGARRG